MSRRRLFVENRNLRKRVNDLESDIDEIQRNCDKQIMQIEKEYEDKNKKEKERNDILAKDNRILMTTMRKKDIEIAELKKKLEESKNVEEY
jgi:hypothetical protein